MITCDGVALLLILLMTRAGWTEGRRWTSKTFPLLKGKCGIRKPNLICDPDKLLNRDDRLSANERLFKMASESECGCFDRGLCRNETGGYMVGIGVAEEVDSLGPRRLDSPPLLVAFAHATRLRWNLGHCADDAIIVICEQCQRVVLNHGDWMARKIPEKVRSTMERQATQLLTFTNTSLALDYLLNNYQTFLSNQNLTPSVSMLILPYQDLSSGVVTVMILTTLLTVAWVLCVTYLLVQFLRRRKKTEEKKQEKKHKLDSGQKPLVSPSEASSASEVRLVRPPLWNWRTGDTPDSVSGSTNNALDVHEKRSRFAVRAEVNRVPSSSSELHSSSALSNQSSFRVPRNGSMPNMPLLGTPASGVARKPSNLS